MFHARRTRTLLLLFLLLAMLAASLGYGQPAAASSGPALNVNAGASQHPIDPLIYGMNFADETLAQELRLPVNRWGGNATTRYNWQNDMANHASDWYFENIPADNPDPASGNAADHFVADNKNAGADSLITITLIGWVAKNRARTDGGYDCGFSTNTYNYTPAPLYQGQSPTDPYNPASADCGTGKRTDGMFVTGNDPHDTSIAVAPAFMQDWVRHLIAKFGNAMNGGVRFYNLDNEPGLWNSTHRDVHPTHPMYDELLNLGCQYAAAIKAVDPGALILGPVQDGWTRYYYASYDTYPDQVAQDDRTAHGGKPFVVWYLQQMAACATLHGARMLDYFDLHYYPQANGVTLSPAGDANTQALRLRTTRSLWDPNYVDESWIPSTGEATPVNGVGVNGAVQLIPRMRDWVNKNYPGTKLAISEYNWGALDDINGALAQADVLGIFGREGLDLATLWDPPAASDPGAFAFRMYRNYDGAGSAFGDTSVSAASADQGQLAIYAARRGDGRLTLMVINKSNTALTSSVGLTGFTSVAPAQVYRYSAADLQHIVRQPDQAVSGSGFSATFPAASITLIVLSSTNLSLSPRGYLPLVRR